MAADNIIGLAMNLDVTSIKEGLSEVNKLIKNSKSEFANATAGMEKWQKSSEGLNAKLKQLGSQLDAQKKLVSGYEAEIKRVAAQEGDHSAQLADLNSKLQKAQAEVKRTESQISKYERSLTDVTRAEKEQNSALGQLNTTIGKQEKELKSLTDEYKSAVIQYGKNSKEAKELSGQIKKLSTELSDNKNKAAQADKAYSDLDKNIQKANKSAKEMAADLGKNVAIAFAGVATAIVGAVKAAQSFADRGDEIAKTAKAIGIGTTALQELRYAANLTGVESETLTKGLQTLNKQMGELALGQGNLAKVAGEYSGELLAQLEAAGSTEEAFNILSAAIASEEDASKRAVLAQAAFGGSSRELVKLLAEGKTGIQELRDEAHTYGNIMSEEATKRSEEFNDSMTRLQSSAQSLADSGLSVLVDKLQPLIQKTADYIAQNKELVGQKIEAIFNGIGIAIDLLYKGMESGLIPAILAVVGAFKAMTIAQAALNVAMNANPIGIIITLCGLLVIAIAKLWHDSEEFRNFFINMWDSIVKGVKKAVESIKGFISNISQVGHDLVTGLWQGINDTTQWILDKIKGFGGKILNGIKDFFGIHSPSTVMADVGENLTEGLAVGMEKGTSRFKSALDRFNQILGEWREGTGKYISQIGDVFDEVRNRVGGLTSAIGEYYNAELESRKRKIDEEMKALDEARQADIEAEKAATDQKQAELDELYNSQLISEEEYNARKQEIQAQYDEFEKQRNEQAAEEERKLNEKKDEIARKQFEANKKNAIAEALINGANAIIKGFAQLGPIGGAINAGIQAGITALQVAAISKQQYVSALAKGGIVDKPTLAVVGEAGKEAVVPLENNTGWIAQLAEKLKEIMDKDISVAGGMAYAGAGGGRVINNYYYQTINSPVPLSRKEIYRDSKNLLSLKG